MYAFGRSLGLNLFALNVAVGPSFLCLCGTPTIFLCFSNKDTESIIKSAAFIPTGHVVSVTFSKKSVGFRP